MPTKKVRRLINGAMHDEHSARLYYSKLINATNDPEEKRKIREIRNDEIDHFKIEKKMLEEE